MNESILKALMRLFAIVANINKKGYSETERSVVIDYLHRQYSYEIVQKYIQYFDQQVTRYQPDTATSDGKSQPAAISADYVTNLCNQINEELEREQKQIVMLYLLDFVCRGETITKEESIFISTVAKALKLREDEYKDSLAFTMGDIKNVVHREWLLFIQTEEKSEYTGIKVWPTEKLDGRIVVLHLPSTNTYVFRYLGNLVLYFNGHDIKPGRSYVWSTGSVIKNAKVGSIYFSRMAGRYIQANIESKFVFTADEIQFNYRNSTNGLKRFSFTEESGRLIGIIGGSGSGKSTLINVLNGNIKPRSGSIKINGFDIHENKELLKGIIGYVPQDDMLIKELTVYQNLYYNAKLCFDRFSEEKIKEIVEKALIDFDLVEARDLSVGDALTTILSGGQRKRLNIALELIREPSILFVDEPTSGLSSADSEKVITLLKRQALKGRLVIANIHQPSTDVFKMLDKLIVMDQGGRIIYYGNPVTAITYFKRAAQHADADESECPSCGNINSDQILRIVEARVVDSNGRLTRKRKTSPDEWYQMYLEKIDPDIRQIKREHDASVPNSYFRIPNHFRQFKVFIKRDVLAKFHNKQYLFLNALEAPVLAIILGFFTKNFQVINDKPVYIFGSNPNLPAFLFMSVIVAMFMGLVISAEEIFKDRVLLKREKFLNLSRSSYLFSKIIILFSISALQTLFFIAISSYMLEIRGMLFYHWLILFTASCWANLIGLIISSSLNSVVTIYILVPIILVPQLLLSGVVVDYDKMHNRIASSKFVPRIGEVITGRWAYEALMVSQFKYNRFEDKFYDNDKIVRNSIFYKSYGIPALNDLIIENDKLKNTGEDSIKKTRNISVIQKEIAAICDDLNWIWPTFIDSMYGTYYNRNAVQQFLNTAERKYINEYNDAVSRRDETYSNLVKKFGGEDKFIKFKQRYYNTRLAEVVTNENELIEYSIQNGEMLRLRDAVFRTPDSRKGRAHFFAPVKRVAGITLGTFWFNLYFIWLYSVLLFVLLYFDVIKKIISYINSFLLSRRNRLRLLRLLKVYEQWEKK
jgi:ABC-type multidrug transport system ATPase subunit